MTFAYLGLRMGNGQAYSQLLGLGMGIQNKIPNCWDWEWGKKSNIQLLGLGMGMKNHIPNLCDWEWDLIPNIWEFEIAFHF